MKTDEDNYLYDKRLDDLTNMFKSKSIKIEDIKYVEDLFSNSVSDANDIIDLIDILIQQGKHHLVYKSSTGYKNISIKRIRYCAAAEATLVDAYSPGYGNELYPLAYFYIGLMSYLKYNCNRYSNVV